MFICPSCLRCSVPPRRYSQHVAGITLPINSNRLHIIQSHTLLNPIVPYVQKIQLPHFCARSAAVLSRRHLSDGVVTSPRPAFRVPRLSLLHLIGSWVLLLHCLTPRVTASCTKCATRQADLALAVTQTSTCIRDDPTGTGWLSSTPLRFSATDGHAIDLGSLQRHKSVRKPRSSEFISVALRLK